jgi:hypothetical protein
MTKRNPVLDAICSQRDHIPLVLAVIILMGLLLIFPFVFLESGSASYVIAVIDVILVTASLLFFGTMYWYCTRRAMDT